MKPLYEFTNTGALWVRALLSVLIVLLLAAAILILLLAFAILPSALVMGESITFLWVVWAAMLCNGAILLLFFPQARLRAFRDYLEVGRGFGYLIRWTIPRESIRSFRAVTDLLVTHPKAWGGWRTIIYPGTASAIAILTSDDKLLLACREPLEAVEALKDALGIEEAEVELAGPPENGVQSPSAGETAASAAESREVLYEIRQCDWGMIAIAIALTLTLLYFAVNLPWKPSAQDGGPLVAWILRLMMIAVAVGIVAYLHRWRLRAFEDRVDIGFGLGWWHKYSIPRDKIMRIFIVKTKRPSFWHTVLGFGPRWDGWQQVGPNTSSGVAIETEDRNYLVGVDDPKEAERKLKKAMGWG